jgi:CubicO group peptidase (beta-lactamase class C family)
VLLFEPGERWNYGVNIDGVGGVVEAARGKRLGEVCRERIFEPFGMVSTRPRFPAASPDGYGRSRHLCLYGRVHEVHPDDPLRRRRTGRHPDPAAGYGAEDGVQRARTTAQRNRSSRVALPGSSCGPGSPTCTTGSTGRTVSEACGAPRSCPSRTAPPTRIRRLRIQVYRHLH